MVVVGRGSVCWLGVFIFSGKEPDMDEPVYFITLRFENISKIEIIIDCRGSFDSFRASIARLF